MTKPETRKDARVRLMSELVATRDWLHWQCDGRVPYLQSLYNDHFALWFRRNGQLAYSNKQHPTVHGDSKAEILISDYRGITAAQVAAELKARGL